MENEATKKLENVKRDHERRLKALDELQENQQKRAELIEMNRDLVDQCLTVIRQVFMHVLRVMFNYFRQALANKMSWDEVQKWVNSAASKGNPIAKTFVRLNLNDNSIVLRLYDPYEHLNEAKDESDDDEGGIKKTSKPKQPPKKKGMEVELDLDM